MSKANLRAQLGMWLECVNSGHILDRHGPGMESMSIDHARIFFDGRDGILPNIPSRKVNVAYAAMEFLWYCGADRADQSICQYATIWKKLIQHDGGINSNYGQYMLNPYIGGAYGNPDKGIMQISQFEHCVQELIANRDSRRASMVLLKQEHLYKTNTDMVCTFGMTFHIRENRLNMHVMMRSNDAVWGLTNDAFCFNMIQRLMVVRLREHYPDLQVGVYVHDAASLHVYKRHYTLASMGYQEEHLYEEVNPPMPDPDDYVALITHHAGGFHAGGVFTDWCRSVITSAYS